MKGSRKHTDHHHLTPRSRGGKVEVEIPIGVHEAWHLLFGNATPDEAKLLIEKYWTTPEVDESIVLPKKCVGYFKRN